MPGVKKLFQDSENSSKPEFIFGHMFGGLRILMGSAAKWFCLPLRFQLQDGMQPAASWAGASVSAASHVVQMVELGFAAARTFGSSYLLLDRYFLSVPALMRLAHLNLAGGSHMEIVTKAKRSCRAYEPPPARKPGRGRPPPKGATVKLWECFSSRAHLFTEAQTSVYGKQEPIRYCCLNLLWGQKLYQELRFVLVEYQGVQSILVSTLVN